MKKLMILIGLTSLSIGSYVNAQETTGSKIYRGEFGIRFMPTFSALDLNTSTGSTVKGKVTLGYGVGAILGFNFSNYVGIQGEVIYNSISQKYEEADVKKKINLTYLNIPLLLSLNTGKSKVVNFNVVAGPQLGLSVGSKIQTTGNNTNSQSAQGVLSVKKGDLGLAYGAGLDFGVNPARSIRIGFGFRGVYGLFDISNNNRTMTTDSYYLLGRTHIKTYSAYLGASILF